jgi:membrane protein DedA with SNARE-associated domain
MPPSPADLPGFLHGVAPILDRWGYLAVAGFIGVESFGVPAPGQTIMVAAAIYAGAGRLSVHRFGKYGLITPDPLAKAEKSFARRGNRIVVVARFIDGLRQLNGVIAGITAMPWRPFLIYNAVGAALWVGWWTTVAYLFGTHLVEIIEHAHRYKWWAIAALVVAIGAYVWLHARHIRRRRCRAALAAAAEREESQA